MLSLLRNQEFPYVRIKLILLLRPPRVQKIKILRIQETNKQKKGEEEEVGTFSWVQHLQCKAAW